MKHALCISRLDFRVVDPKSLKIVKKKKEYSEFQVQAVLDSLQKRSTCFSKMYPLGGDGSNYLSNPLGGEG